MGGTKKISGGAGGSTKDDAMTEKTPIVAHSNTIFVKFWLTGPQYRNLLILETVVGKKPDWHIF